MRKAGAGIFLIVCVLAVSGPARDQDANLPSSIITADTVTISVEQQFDAVRPGSDSALAVRFELKKDWHFYGSGKTAPGGMNLKIRPVAEEDFVSFSRAAFPRPRLYFDKSSGKKLEVFSGKFTVYLPFSAGDIQLGVGEGIAVDVKIGIEGAVCSDIQCRVPDFGQLSAKIKISPDAAMAKPRFVLPEAPAAGEWASYSVWFALGLAFLAGLSLNIMPCVWPVLPLIVMRIVEQSKQGKGGSAALGLGFCLGILLFFASLAGANIILQIFYGTVLQWGDQFRNPAFVAGMALLLVVLALFMFDVFTVTIPSAVASKSGTGKGYAGAVGMGFLAAVLSTPCSFAILAVAFAWAQAQPLVLGTLAIMFIGVGMAGPYAILTSMPGLLNRLPKAGRWMELFKQTIGFVLLVIAVKLIGALPQVRRIGVLYFAVVLSFSVWMWSSWVSFNTKRARKWLVRAIALVLAVAAGAAFLPGPGPKLIDWRGYDADLIEAALAEQRPVLIKFTADWCLSCQVVDKTVYSNRNIAKLIEEKGVLAIRADTTTKDQLATAALKNLYNEPGVPVSMLFVPGKRKSVRWRGMAFADELRAHLEKLASSK